jgi:hypothetical protein
MQVAHCRKVVEPDRANNERRLEIPAGAGAEHRMRFSLRDNATGEVRHIRRQKPAHSKNTRADTQALAEASAVNVC